MKETPGSCGGWSRPRQGLTQLRIRLVLIITVLACLGMVSCDETGKERAPVDVPRVGGSYGSGETSLASGLAKPEHAPRHGGIVHSVDVYRVEIVPSPLEVWLYDRRGDPLPLDDVSGRLVVYSEDEVHPYRLEREEEHFSPIEPVTLPDTGSAFVELTIDQQPIDVALALPLRSQSPEPPDVD